MKGLRLPIVFALFLCPFMVSALFPVTAFAQDPDPVAPVELTKEDVQGTWKVDFERTKEDGELDDDDFDEVEKMVIVITPKHLRVSEDGEGDWEKMKIKRLEGEGGVYALELADEPDDEILLTLEGKNKLKIEVESEGTVFFTRGEDIKKKKKGVEKDLAAFFKRLDGTWTVDLDAMKKDKRCKESLEEMEDEKEMIKNAVFIFDGPDVTVSFDGGEDTTRMKKPRLKDGALRATMEDDDTTFELENEDKHLVLYVDDEVVILKRK